MSPGLSSLVYVWALSYLCLSKSATSPEIDKSDVGNRDKHLLSSYKGLVNIRCVYFLVFSFVHSPQGFCLARGAMIHSWSSAVGPGNPSFSKVLLSCVDINKRSVYCVFHHLCTYFKLIAFSGFFYLQPLSSVIKSCMWPTCLESILLSSPLVTMERSTFIPCSTTSPLCSLL